MKQLRGGGITQIKVQDQDRTWQEKTTKETIESGCMEENIKKYRQTENTISMQEPLCNILGHQVKSDTTNRILEGTLRLLATNQYTQELLHELQEVIDLKYPTPKTTMTTKDFRNGWGKMKYTTVTLSSPQSTHDHYKCRLSSLSLKDSFIVLFNFDFLFVKNCIRSCIA